MGIQEGWENVGAKQLTHWTQIWKCGRGR